MGSRTESNFVNMPAGQFKAQCLALMDLVNQTHERVVITKRGVPVAQLVPVSAEKTQSLHGFLKGHVVEEGDILSPMDINWEADSG